LAGNGSVDLFEELDGERVRLGPSAEISPVVVAIEEHALAGPAVAPGAAYLLVIGGQATRRVEMHDEADVGLVDAHTEGDGSDYDSSRARHEAILDFGPAVEAGMVCLGLNVEPAQLIGQRLAFVPAVHIDNAGALGARYKLEEGCKLLVFAVILESRQVNVGAEDV